MRQKFFIKVLNDPVSYINHERFAWHEQLDITSTEMRHSLNNIIFEVFDLKYDSFHASESDIFWICNWDNIKYIVYIIGCLSLKEELLWRGAVCKLPCWVFNALRAIPFCFSDKGENTGSLNTTEIVSQGFTRIKSHLMELTPCIQKRINLLFPDYVDECVSQYKIPFNILNVVSIYVKSDSFRRELQT
ncbi:hypothetical protein, partial [Methanosarcina mazei]|uniref:hypothetical protein n=1 Tax=Methanosarcina mazei TaxID=2209 RepID=UPI0012D375E8